MPNPPPPWPRAGPRCGWRPCCGSWSWRQCPRSRRTLTDTASHARRRRPRIADRAGADQRAVVAEPGGRDAGGRRTAADARVASISSWAALKNVAAKPSATSPPTTTRSRSSTLHTEADAATDEAPGAAHDVVRRLGRRATGDRLDREARRLGLEAARGAARAAPPVRLDDDVADVAGVAGGTVDQLAVEHDAAADAGRHDDRAEVLCPWAAPSQPSARVSALASRSPNTGQPGQLAAGAGAARTPRHDGMLTGDTVSQLRSIGPAQPTPIARTRTLCWSRARRAARATIRPARRSATAGRRRGRRARRAVEQLAAERHESGRELGPPMSIARIASRDGSAARADGHRTAARSRAGHDPAEKTAAV